MGETYLTVYCLILWADFVQIILKMYLYDIVLFK